MDRDQRAHYYGSHTAQANKIDVLQVLTSNKGACYQNRKPNTLPFLYNLNLLSLLPTLLTQET